LVIVATQKPERDITNRPKTIFGEDSKLTQNLQFLNLLIKTKTARFYEGCF